MKYQMCDLTGFKRQAPNLITLLRIGLCIGIIWTKPLSSSFIIIYAVAILSDVIDGAIARHYNLMSELGAKLDSLADLILFLVISFKLIPLIEWQTWIIVGIVTVIILRSLAVLVGYIKYHEIAILHTYANKLTGFLCVGIPFSLQMNWLSLYAGVLILIGIGSAVEETMIHLTSKQLDLNAKFIKWRQ